MNKYQKLKATIVDLSDVLDEAVAFESFVGSLADSKQLAYAHLANGIDPGLGEKRYSSSGIRPIAGGDERSDINENRLTRITLS